jgi:hypothetical protein
MLQARGSEETLFQVRHLKKSWPGRGMTPYFRTAASHSELT